MVRWNVIKTRKKLPECRVLKDDELESNLVLALRMLEGKSYKNQQQVKEIES